MLPQRWEIQVVYMAGLYSSHPVSCLAPVSVFWWCPDSSVSGSAAGLAKHHESCTEHAGSGDAERAGRRRGSNVLCSAHAAEVLRSDGIRNARTRVIGNAGWAGHRCLCRGHEMGKASQAPAPRGIDDA